MSHEFKYADLLDDDVFKLVFGREVFDRIFKESELFKMDSETRNKVKAKMTTERDLRNQMAWAMQEARTKGLAEGRQEERADIVKKMHSNGMTANQICAILEIPLLEIEKILGE